MEFIDLKAQYQHLKVEIDQALAKVLAHGRFIMGPEVEELEEKLAAFVGRKYCLSCASGTDALMLAFLALGPEPEDAVFCPAVTFIATAEPAAMLGAKIVFCDIDPVSYNLAPASLKQQIKAVISEGKYRPKAVVAVDFLGNPADYPALEAICREYDLPLISDAAQSFGASLGGKRCGSFGLMAAASFFPAKPLGCYGDGGAIFTDDQELAQVLRSLRVHGQGSGGKYDNIRLGLNSRLDTLQASILLPKLKALETQEIEARHVVAQRYNKGFEGLLTTPEMAKGALSIYAQYALLAKNQPQRDHIIAALSQAGIPSMVYYPTPQHRLPVFKYALTCGNELQVAEDYCRRTLSLPMHPYLTKEDQQLVIDTVKNALR